MKKSLTSIFFLIFGWIAMCVAGSFTAFATAIFLRCLIRAWKLGWLMFALLAVTAVQATPVLFSEQAITGGSANRAITVVPDNSGSPLVLGTNLQPTSTLLLQPSGGQIITNLVPWGYTFSVDGWSRGLHFVVADGTDIVNVTSLITTNWYSPLYLNLADTNALLAAATNAAFGKARDATNGLASGAFTTLGNAALGDTNFMSVLSATRATLRINSSGAMPIVASTPENAFLLNNAPYIYNATILGGDGSLLTNLSVNQLIDLNTNNFGGLSAAQVGSQIQASVLASNLQPATVTVSTIYNGYQRQSLNTYLSPLQTADWLYSGDNRIPTFHGDSWYLNENGLANDRYYVFALAIPFGTTNIAYSYSCRALSGSVQMKTEFYCPASSPISQSNATVTTSYSSISGNCYLTSASWTNNAVCQFFLRPQGAVAVSTNITITYQPTPANPVLANPFTRVAVMPKNVARDMGSMNASILSSRAPYPYEAPLYDFAVTRASTHSYVDFETDATNLVLEIWTDVQGQSSYSQSGPAGLTWGTNLITANTPSATFQPLTLAKKANNTVRVTAGYSSYGYGEKNLLRAIYVPAANYVRFKKETGGTRVLIIGDSRVCSVNVVSRGLENTLEQLMESYYPCEVYNYAQSGGPLNGLWGNAGNKAAFVRLLSEVKPDILWDEFGYIDWSLGTGTNLYFTQQNDLLDTVHELLPFCKIFVQPFDYNTYDALVAGSYQADYNNMAAAAANLRTNFCVYLNWTNLLSGLKQDGVHDTESGSAERAYLMLKQIYTNTLVPSGLSYRMRGTTTNYAVPGGLTLYVTNGIVGGIR